MPPTQIMSVQQAYSWTIFKIYILRRDETRLCSAHLSRRNNRRCSSRYPFLDEMQQPLPACDLVDRHISWAGDTAAWQRMDNRADMLLSIGILP